MSSSLLSNFPTRIQEEIRIFNMSLPLSIEENSKENIELDSDYEPAFIDLLKTAECPVCRCIPTPPIYNCLNGHISCISCLPRLPSRRCGYCTAPFTKMRNYPLENLVTAAVLSCDFQSAGCTSKNLTMAEYEDHIKACGFRPSPSFKRPITIRHEPKDSILQEINHSCPRCKFLNSKRKLKCHNCELNLRVATPMCGRHVLGDATCNKNAK